MKFGRYKLLVLKVFPDFEQEFGPMEDNLRTYQQVFVKTCPADPTVFNDLNDFERADLFSLINITSGRMRGQNVWKTEK